MGEPKNIGMARESDGRVYVYDKKGRALFNRQGKLFSCTDSLVTIIRGRSAVSYDAKGSVQFVKIV